MPGIGKKPSGRGHVKLGGVDVVCTDVVVRCVDVVTADVVVSTIVQDI